MHIEAVEATARVSFSDPDRFRKVGVPQLDIHHPDGIDPDLARRLRLRGAQRGQFADDGRPQGPVFTCQGHVLTRLGERKQDRRQRILIDLDTLAHDPAVGAAQFHLVVSFCKPSELGNNIGFDRKLAARGRSATGHFGDGNPTRLKPGIQHCGNIEQAARAAGPRRWRRLA